MKKILFIILFLTVSFMSSFADPGQTIIPKADSVKTTAMAKATKDSAAVVTVNAKTDSTTKVPAIQCATSDNNAYTWIGWSLIALILGAFFALAWWSDLLRNSIMNPVTFMLAAKATPQYTDTHVNKIPKPFSLARSQLGIWTVVIGCSYVYLELCKYAAFPGISVDNTLLALMGISAATATAGNIIDNNLTPEQQGVVRPSEGFFKDILSDQNGINIHRFQNVIWTLIAVVLYLCQVPKVPCGHLPTLDSTLLVLTGLSNVTYLGLKINENKPPVIPKTPPAA